MKKIEEHKIKLDQKKKSEQKETEIEKEKEKEKEENSKILKKSPQLISFSLGDLIRCRYTSKEDEILTIYQKLQNDPDIKIVRVKNRLSGGNRDILINALFKNEVMTEIQLCIKSEKSKFIECSNQFNHFLYELKRAQFGPISEMVNIWVNYDKRSEHYLRRINELFGPKGKRVEDYQITEESSFNCCSNRSVKEVSLPFQCSCCESHYFDVYESDGNTFCESCNKFVCLDCDLKLEEISKLLVGDSEILENITVMKEKSIFDFSELYQQNLVLLNLRSKKRKVRPFRIIHESNKIHLFEKIQNTDKLDLIKTFKKNENLKKEVEKFLNQNLVIQIYDETEFAPEFDFKYTRENYFNPLLLKEIKAKQKSNIFMRGKHINDKNIEIVSVFDKVKKIDFEENHFTKDEIIAKQFPNIEYANLRGNKMTILSKNILEIPKLKILNLESNRIIKLPERIENQQLELLLLHNNKIEEIPDQFFNFDKLKILTLSYNNIMKLPENKPNMNCLEEFNLENNKIEEIPDQFFNFDKLKRLSLSNNKIKKLPKNKPNMKCLELLIFEKNEIEEIPDEFFNFDQLKLINLSKNKIKKLPEIKPNMNNLEQFSLEGNEIEEIPDEFFNFDKLETLNLIDNKIKKLPICKPNMNCLENLLLSMNQISIIPASLEFENLKYLLLNDNPIAKIEETLISPKLKRLMIGSFDDFVPKDFDINSKTNLLNILKIKSLEHFNKYNLKELKR